MVCGAVVARTVAHLKSWSVRKGEARLWAEGQGSGLSCRLTDSETHLLDENFGEEGWVFCSHGRKVIALAIFGTDDRLVADIVVAQG